MMELEIFFVTALNYCCKWLPLNSDFLKYCIFVAFRKRKDIPFQYVGMSIPYFKKVYEEVVEDQNVLEEYHDEFIEYQSLPDSAIPATIWEKAKVTFNDKKMKDRCSKDVIWGHLRERFPRSGEAEGRGGGGIGGHPPKKNVAECPLK